MITVRRVLALGLVAVLTGCVGLPAYSEVQTGRDVDEKLGAQARVLVPPPEVGATPEQIVRGFLLAGAAFQEPSENGDVVGKSYLDPDSVDRWNPTMSVTVFDRLTLVNIEQLGPTSIKATTEAVATIDELGRYRELPPDTLVDVVFDLVRIEGEWRIRLPAAGFGIWVNTDDFGRLFAAYRISYPVIGTRRLLPDVRWFPSGPRLATALARAQLSPVPDFLRGVAETGFPEGAKLAVDAVTVSNGLATVVLTGPASAADLGRRRAMWAQLVATLLVVPSVTRVSIEVLGSGRLGLPDTPEAVSSIVELGFTRDPVPLSRTGILRNGEELRRIELTRLGEAEATIPPIPGPELPAIPTDFVGLAISPDGLDLAAVSQQGNQLARWKGRSRLDVEGLGSALTRPTYDATGRLWVAGLFEGRGTLWCLDVPGGQVKAVSIPIGWLAERQPLAISISRDGTRAALASVARDGHDARVHLAGIVRAGDGMPVSLAEPLAIDPAFREVAQLAWIDDISIAVLGSLGPDEQLRPYLFELGQGIGLRRRGLSDPVDALIPVAPQARAVLSTSGGLRGLVVLAQPSSVLVRVGNAWRQIPAATELAIPPVRQP